MANSSSQEATPKVAFLINSIAAGGAERSLLLLAESLARRGQLQAFVTLQQHRSQYEIPEILRPLHHCLRVRGLLSALLRYWLLVRRTGIQVTFSALPQANFVGVAVAALSGGVAMTSQRFVLHRFYGSSIREFLKKQCILVTHRFANAVICISREVKADLDSSGYQLCHKTRVLYNPIDWRPDTPCARSVLLASREGEEVGGLLRLVTAGRLVPEKGLLELIAAIGALRARVPLMLDIFGDGPERERIQGRIELLGATNFIRLRGFSANMASAYADYDLFIFNSNSEGFGRVIFEAFSASLPVLYPARLHAPGELLAGLDGVAVFQYCDAASLLAGIRSIGAASRQKFDAAVLEVRAALSVETHADGFVHVLRTVSK